MSTADKVLAALQPYDLKRLADGSYQCNSPFRPGSNSHALHLTIIDGEHGMWKDHARDETEQGSLYDIARRLNIEPEKPITPSVSMTTKRAYANAEEYATAHGLTLLTLRAFGWEPTKHRGRPALRFVTDNGPRYRYLDGNDPTYAHERNYKPCWYRLDEAITIARESGQPLVLCNGEISTVTAQYYGVAAACMTSSGERLLNPEALDYLKSRYTGPIFIALDSDKKGRKATQQLSEQLRAAQFESVASIDLGGHEGYDLADFCTLHEATAAEALQAHIAPSSQSAATSEHPRDVYPLYDLDGLDTLPPTQWLIKGHIPADSFIMLAGESGAGKSFLSVDYALRIAIEHPDRDVVYIAPEGASGYAKRVRAWLQHHRIERPRNLRFILQTVPLLDSAAVARLLATLVPLKPAFIVVDTLSRAMAGGDENSPSDMGRFVYHCEQVRQATKAAVMAVHHYNKNGTYRGHSSLFAACDVVLELEDDDGLLILSNTKAKDDSKFAPLHYRRLTLNLGSETEVNEKAGDPITSCVIVPASTVTDAGQQTLTAREKMALELMSLKTFEQPGIKAAQLSEMLKIPIASVYRATSRLLDNSLITQGTKGDPYFISEKGRRALAVNSQHTDANYHELSSNYHSIIKPAAPVGSGFPSPLKGEGETGNPETAQAARPRENAAPVTRQVFPSVPPTRPAAPTALAADELPEEPGDLWGEAAPASSRSTPSAAQAERQATADAKVNARVKELVGRACDNGNWSKALTEAGKARGADARRELEALIRFREEEARGGHVVPEGY